MLGKLAFNVDVTVNKILMHSSDSNESWWQSEATLSKAVATDDLELFTGDWSFHT